MSGLLGAVLAGGQSRRFGSDKALALYQKKRLIDHATAALAHWCAQVIIVGRDGAVADWPTAGRGPLGGLAGACLYAEQHGFENILVTGVDSLMLPEDLLAQLTPGPSFVEDQPVVGLWPVTVGHVVRDILKGPGPYALRTLATQTAARGVRFAVPPANINRPEDLADLEKRHGL